MSNMNNVHRCLQSSNPQRGLARSLLGLSVLALAAGFTSASYSQQRTATLEEIMVTASRREAGLQSTPISMSAVTGEALANKGISSFSDLTKVTSGLYLEQVSNSTSASLRVRGVGTRGQSPSDPAVGVLVDGVYQIRQGAAFTEMLDVERVEVLRGPQGTMFGRNTTAGVIHIYTKDPDTEEFSGKVQGVLGNLDNREVRGVVNIPLMEGRLAARVSGYKAERDGYARNVFLSEDTRNIDREGGRIKLLWNATDDLSVKLTAETLEQRFRLESSLVEYGPSAISAMTAAGLDPADHPISLGRGQNNRPERAVDNVDRYIMHVDWSLPNHTLRSITSYEEVETRLQQDTDSTAGQPNPPGLAGIDNENSTKATTQELQLSSEFGGPFSYIVGAFWQNEELESLTTLYIGNNVIPRPPTVRDVKSTAVFGNASYDLTDRLTASLGLRYTDDEKQGFDLATQDPDAIRNFREWTYSAKLQYQYSPDMMVYFSHDKGFKSGGFNRGDLVAQVGAEFNYWEPEITYAYELGMKSEWLDRRLRLNASVFYQDYEDYQVTQSIEGTGTVLITNAAEVRSKGIETDFAFAVSPNLTLDGSVSYIRTEYQDYQNAPCSINSTARPGCNQVGSQFFQDLSGRQLDNAPKWTGNIGAEYRTEVVTLDGVDWFIRANASYRGDTLLGEFLPAESKQKAYTLYSLRTGFEAMDGQWKVTLWGNNLTDEQYAVAGNFTNTGLTKVQGTPRTFGVTADWAF